MKKFFVTALLLTGLVAGSANAAVISWSTDDFDADADISTNGTLVAARNEGDSGTSVTVNGVVFDGATVDDSFFVSGTDGFVADIYGGGAIGSLSSASAQTLLDYIEFGPGAGNSLARFSGLTIGDEYEVQLLLVNDRASTAAFTASVGHSTPSGDLTEVYTLTGIDHTSNAPQVITGTFTATEALQDIQLGIFDGGSENGEISAWQLRNVTIPEPSSVCLMAFGLLGMVGFGRRQK